jgi:outer membrane receptor protein involved in Fe transport
MIYQHFHRDNNEGDDRPTDITTVELPLTLRYFHPSGLFGAVGVTYVNQTVKRVNGASTLADGTDNFALLDASVGYRLPKRYGIASIGLQNVLDRKFKYQDDNFRTSETMAPNIVPDLTVIGRLSLSF